MYYYSASESTVNAPYRRRSYDSSMTFTPYNDSTYTPRSERAEGDYFANSDLTRIPMTTVEEQSFPRFPQLPREIRDMIWQMAVRPEDPRGGVHRFRIMHWNYFRKTYDNEIKNDRGGTESRLPVRWNENLNFWAGPRRDWGKEYSLAVPVIAGTTCSLKCPENMSTYSWDMGLWRACIESREAMTAHYNLNIRTRAGEKELERFALHKLAEPDLARLPPVLALADSDREALPILFTPEQDLFILNYEDFGVGVDTNSAFFGINNIPGGKKQSYMYWWETRHLQNIAIEFDSSWYDAQVDNGWGLHWRHFDDLLEDESPHGALARLSSAACRVNDRNGDEYPYIWLIDRRLGTLSEETDPWSSEYKVFKGIDGLVYKETRFCNRNRRNEELHYPSAQNYLRWFQALVSEGLRREFDPDETPDPRREDEYLEVRDHIGVLSCREVFPKSGK